MRQLGQRVYGWLLKMHPARFRVEFEYEMALDFEAMMADKDWMVIDIINPLDVDHYLETVGGWVPKRTLCWP